MLGNRPRLSLGNRPRLSLFLPTAALLLAASQPATAEAQFRIGGHGVYQNQIVGGDFGAGGRAEVDLAFLRDGLTIAATYDHLFLDCESCRSFEAGGEILFGPGPLFAGLGAAYRGFDPGDDSSMSASDNEWAFSLVAGLRFPQVPVVTPFAAFRQQIGSDANRQTISVGVLVGPRERRRAPRRPGPGIPSAAR